MIRYFFDCVGQSRRLYDFHGRRLSGDGEAQQLAELLALNLDVEGDEEFVGGRVEVRNPQGGTLLFVAIPRPEQRGD